MREYSMRSPYPPKSWYAASNDHGPFLASRFSRKATSTSNADDPARVLNRLSSGNSWPRRRDLTWPPTVYSASCALAEQATNKIVTVMT